VISRLVRCATGYIAGICWALRDRSFDDTGKHCGLYPSRSASSAGSFPTCQANTVTVHSTQEPVSDDRTGIGIDPDTVADPVTTSVTATVTAPATDTDNATVVDTGEVTVTDGSRCGGLPPYRYDCFRRLSSGLPPSTFFASRMETLTIRKRRMSKMARPPAARWARAQSGRRSPGPSGRERCRCDCCDGIHHS
jgi:hypothetical protein